MGPIRWIAAVSIALLLPVSQPVTADGAQDRPVPKATGAMLYNGISTYPRLIRLEHSGAANGRVIASVNGVVGPGVQQGALIFSSDDDGQHFQKIAAIPDLPESRGTGICCGTIFEVPQQIGVLPPGTLLWSANVGFDKEPQESRQTRLRVWRSDDHGHTWNYVSDMAVVANHENGWEPEFSVTADGRLAGYYSDESDRANHDQKLVKVASSDGVHWSQPEDLVLHKTRTVRPGMAIVRRLPDGSYIMVYEICNTDLVHLCSIYFRKSADGWDWGDPYDLGTEVRTADGKYVRATPTVAWSQGPGPHGTILLGYQMLVNEDGSFAPGNGRTILGNDNLGTGPWYEMPTPVQIDGVKRAGCKNFSPSLLPSRDGKRVLQMATDEFAANDCRAYFATGPLTPPQPPAISTPAHRSPGH